MSNLNEKIDNTIGTCLFLSSIGLVLYRISKYKSIEDRNVNYYIISDMNINPSPFYLRRNENHSSSIESLNIDKKAIRDLIKEKINNETNIIKNIRDNILAGTSSKCSTPIQSSDIISCKELDNDIVCEKILSNHSSPTSSISSRKKNKDLSSRPTVHAPNPIRNSPKENNSTNTTTTTATATNSTTNSTTNSPITNSSPLPDESSISSSPSYFYDITSPLSIKKETISSMESNKSESFNTPRTGPILIHQEKKISNDNNNENVWISPIFADVIKWEISNNGIVTYVLECRTTRGPALEWSCNKTMEQFYELKKQLNSLLDLDLDQDDLLSTNQFNNYDNDTTLWRNCSIISKFMMTITKREDVMKKSSTFHLVTDFLDPDN